MTVLPLTKTHDVFGSWLSLLAQPCLPLWMQDKSQLCELTLLLSPSWWKLGPRMRCCSSGSLSVQPLSVPSNRDGLGWVKKMKNWVFACRSVIVKQSLAQSTSKTRPTRLEKNIHVTYITWHCPWLNVGNKMFSMAIPGSLSQPHSNLSPSRRDVSCMLLVVRTDRRERARWSMANTTRRLGCAQISYVRQEHAPLQLISELFPMLSIKIILSFIPV